MGRYRYDTNHLCMLRIIKWISQFSRFQMCVLVRHGKNHVIGKCITAQWKACQCVYDLFALLYNIYGCLLSTFVVYFFRLKHVRGHCTQILIFDIFCHCMTFLPYFSRIFLSIFFYVILLCKWMLWNSVCTSLKPWSNFTSIFALRNFKDAQKLRLDQNFILITFLTSLFIFLLQFSSFSLQEISILLTMSKEKKKWKKKFSHFSYFFSPYSHSQLN